MNAEKARQISKEAKALSENEIFRLIKCRAKIGYTSCYLDYLSDLQQEKLKKLGYSIEIVRGSPNITW